MDKEERKSRLKDVRNFLIVVVSGVLSAVLLAGALVYYYSPSGRYVVDQVVLSPEVAGKLSPADNKSGLVFDGIEFTYYLGGEKGWVRIQASNEAYEEFYELISSDKSLWSPSEDVVKKFAFEKPASVFIRVKGGPLLASRVFQEIQILPDGTYRVELRQVDDRNRWAYFHQDDLYDDMKKIFLPHE